MEARYLGRDDSMVSPGTWEYLDSCMISVARGLLAGRKVLEIEGPLGYGAKGIPSGIMNWDPGSPGANISR